MADSVKVDGEMARADSYAKTHTNLIRIDESLFDGNLSAFTAKPSIKIHSWNDIKAGHYRV